VVAQADTCALAVDKPQSLSVTGPWARRGGPAGYAFVNDLREFARQWLISA
jgi:hypothetical protein